MNILKYALYKKAGKLNSLTNLYKKLIKIDPNFASDCKALQSQLNISGFKPDFNAFNNATKDLYVSNRFLRGGIERQKLGVLDAFLRHATKNVTYPEHITSAVRNTQQSPNLTRLATKVQRAYGEPQHRFIPRITIHENTRNLFSRGRDLNKISLNLTRNTLLPNNPRFIEEAIPTDVLHFNYHSGKPFNFYLNLDPEKYKNGVEYAVTQQHKALKANENTRKLQDLIKDLEYDPTPLADYRISSYLKGRDRFYNDIYFRRPEEWPKSLMYDRRNWSRSYADGFNRADLDYFKADVKRLADYE